MSRLREIWRRRELLYALIMRDLSARYRSSVLGFFWSLLNPLLMMGIYTLVFQYYMRFQWDEPHPYALYLLVGLIPWAWFASSLSEGASSIIAGANMVKNIHFPAEILPLVSVFANFVHCLIGTAFLLAFLWVGGVGITQYAALVPLVMVIQFAMTFGATLALAALTVFFRDVQHLLVNLLSIWFFLCPIIYKKEALGAIPSWAEGILRYNPLTPVIMAYQSLLYAGQLPSRYEVVFACGWAGAFLLVGFLVFGSLRDTLAEGL